MNNYFIYILTNYNKTVLYTGITNNIERRLYEHKNENKKSFTSKYKCYYLIYWERFIDVNDAIRREKEIKGWTRIKKETLIETQNPNWEFLNDHITDASQACTELVEVLSMTITKNCHYNE